MKKWISKYDTVAQVKRTPALFKRGSLILQAQLNQ